MRVNTKLYHRRDTLYLRINVDRKSSYLKIAKLDAKYYNPKNSTVRTSYVGHAALMRKYEDLAERAQAFYGYSAKQIKKYLIEGDPNNTPTLVEYTQKFLPTFKFDNRAHYVTMINHINKSPIAGIRLDEITPAALDDFKIYLHTSIKGKSAWTRYHPMAKIRSMLNKAMAAGVITHAQNPFSMGYKLERGQSKHEALNIEQLKMIWLNKERAPALQAFLLSFFLDGARFTDVITLKWQQISDVVEITDSKTGKQRVVGLTDRLTELLSCIREQFYYGKNSYVLPYLNERAPAGTHDELREQMMKINNSVNASLKWHLPKIGITKRVSFHMARHTYAAVAKSNNVDLYAISKSLNHSSLDQTADYIGRLSTDALADKRGGLHDLL